MPYGPQLTAEKNSVEHAESADEALQILVKSDNWTGTKDYGGPKFTHKLIDGEWFEFGADGTERNVTAENRRENYDSLSEHLKIISDLKDKSFSIVIKESSEVKAGTEIAKAAYDQKIHATIYILRGEEIEMKIFDGTQKEFKKQFEEEDWMRDLMEDDDDITALPPAKINQTTPGLNSALGLSSKNQTEAKAGSSAWDNFWQNLFKSKEGIEQAEQEPKGLLDFFDLQDGQDNQEHLIPLKDNQPNLLDLFASAPVEQERPEAVMPFDPKTQTVKILSLEPKDTGVRLAPKTPSTTVAGAELKVDEHQPFGILEPRENLIIVTKQDYANKPAVEPIIKLVGTPKIQIKETTAPKQAKKENRREKTAITLHNAPVKIINGPVAIIKQTRTEIYHRENNYIKTPAENQPAISASEKTSAIIEQPLLEPAALTDVKIRNNDELAVADTAAELSLTALAPEQNETALIANDGAIPNKAPAVAKKSASTKSLISIRTQKQPANKTLAENNTTIPEKTTIEYNEVLESSSVGGLELKQLEIEVRTQKNQELRTGPVIELRNSHQQPLENITLAEIEVGNSQSAVQAVETGKKIIQTPSIVAGEAVTAAAKKPEKAQATEAATKYQTGDIKEISRLAPENHTIEPSKILKPATTIREAKPILKQPFKPVPAAIYKEYRADLVGDLVNIDAEDAAVSKPNIAGRGEPAVIYRALQALIKPGLPRFEQKTGEAKRPSAVLEPIKPLLKKMEFPLSNISIVKKFEPVIKESFAQLAQEIKILEGVMPAREQIAVAKALQMPKYIEKTGATFVTPEIPALNRIGSKERGYDMAPHTVKPIGIKLSGPSKKEVIIKIKKTENALRRDYEKTSTQTILDALTNLKIPRLIKTGVNRIYGENPRPKQKNFERQNRFDEEMRQANKSKIFRPTRKLFEGTSINGVRPGIVAQDYIEEMELTGQQTTGIKLAA